MRKLSFMLPTAVLASLALAASLALPASAAVTARSSAQLIATGSVTDASGHAMPGDKVNLYAWPSDTVLQGLHPNQKVPRKLLATTTADSKGDFSFSVSPATLASAAVSSGNANLEADSGSGSWFFVRNTAGPAPATRIHITAPNQKRCAGGPWTYSGQLRQAWGSVGQSYDPHATKVTQSFYYGAGQSSKLGTGFSATGKVGSFTTDGSNSVSTNDGEGFPSFSKPSNNVYRTHFRIAKYFRVCPPGPLQHHVASDGWAAGEKMYHPAHAPSYPSYTCQPFLGSPGHAGSFHTTHATAVTWKTGLNIAAVGFSTTALTGYSNTAKVTYTFTANRHVCGSDAQPPDAQQTIATK